MNNSAPFRNTYLIHLLDKLGLGQGSTRSARILAGWKPTATRTAPNDPASVLTYQVSGLAQHPDVMGAAFQCVAVSVFQTLQRVLRQEKQVASMAMSLAQYEKFDAMAHTVEVMAKTLRPLILPHAARMLEATDHASHHQRRETSWWFALSEAIQTLEEGCTGVGTLVGGQSEESATRTLCTLVSTLLEDHHQALLTEAELWLE